MAPSVSFSGVILAGGASQRMGQDKALIELGQHKLIEVAALALAGAGAAEVFAVGGDAEALAELDLNTVPDQFPGEGPLGGLITALEGATCGVVAVLGCDHPWTNAQAVTTVLRALGGADAAIPITEGHWQTTHSVWRAAAADALRAAFDDGVRSIKAGARGLDVNHFRPQNSRWFEDMDTPADLAAHRALTSADMPSQDYKE